MVWELVFMLVLLKIPLVYLCMVVWWAIRAEPREEQPVVAVPRPGHARTADRLVAAGARADVARRPPRRRTARSGLRTGRARVRRAGERASRSGAERLAATDTIAGLLAVASIVLSGIAMGFGLLLQLDARPARARAGRDPRSRSSPRG